MSPDLSHLSSSFRSSRVLIAENSSKTRSLIRAVGDRRLDVNCDVCTSQNHAIMKLFCSPSRYQLVICSVQLAEMDEFLLLKHNRMLQPFVPFVVTASAAEQGSARQALERGAFDLISHPVEQEQIVSTIRLALWHSKLEDLIARHETVRDTYRQHMADFPDDTEKMDETFSRALAVAEEASASVNRTIFRIEQSMACLSKVEQYVRKRALERLARTSQ